MMMVMMMVMMGKKNKKKIHFQQITCSYQNPWGFKSVFVAINNLLGRDKHISKVILKITGWKWRKNIKINDNYKSLKID